MKFPLILVLALCLLAPPAWAVSCYTPEQFRAEQAIRFHTGLMVTGLYCQKTLKQNTYKTYQDFTRRNQNVIHSQGNQLIAFFRDEKRPSPEKSLHSLRTDLANKTSLQASKSINAFCRTYAPNLHQANTMIPRDFQRWIDQISTSKLASTTQPVCATPRKSR